MFTVLKLLSGLVFWGRQRALGHHKPDCTAGSSVRYVWINAYTNRLPSRPPGGPSRKRMPRKENRHARR